ncbi:hypothetical protein ABK040_001411 [Willaertia magna]
MKQQQVLEGELFDIPDYYQVENLIGRGSYGVVCSAIDKRTNEKVAIKKISNIFQKNKDYQKRIVRELKILKHYSSIKHENIVQLKDVVVPKSVNELHDLYIITEKFECTLRDVFKTGQQFTDINIKYFLYHLLKGISFIHSSGIAHRDIKPQNILVDENFRIAYCDFGLSRAVELDSKISTCDIASLWYRSPEVILGWEYAGKQMDIWAIGCIFAEMLNNGKVLFQGSSALDVLDKMIDVLGSPKSDSEMKGSFKAIKYLKSLPKKEGQLYLTINNNNILTEEAYDLLSKMLHWDPTKRITAQEALQHSYLSYIRDQYEGDDEQIICLKKFEYKFDESMKTESIRKFLYEELVNFTPSSPTKISTIPSIFNSSSGSSGNSNSVYMKDASSTGTTTNNAATTTTNVIDCMN